MEVTLSDYFTSFSGYKNDVSSIRCSGAKCSLPISTVVQPDLDLYLSGLQGLSSQSSDQFVHLFGLSAEEHIKAIKVLNNLLPYYSLLALDKNSESDGKLLDGFYFFSKNFNRLDGGDRCCIELSIDLTRSRLFFLEKVLEDFERKDISLERSNIEEMASLYDSKAKVDNGNILFLQYWAAQAQGYLEAKKTGRTTRENTYVNFLLVLLTMDAYDPNLVKSMIDMKKLIKRVQLRFDDLTDIINHQGKNLKPAILKNPSFKKGKNTIINNYEQSMLFSQIDGYHRLFWSWFFRLDQLNTIIHITNDQWDPV